MSTAAEADVRADVGPQPGAGLGPVARNNPVRWLLIGLLRCYRLLISPLYGQVCRYHPTCSAYALGAVTDHGAACGAWLAVRRLARCHPWSPGGYDPVPPARPARSSPTSAQEPE